MQTQQAFAARCNDFGSGHILATAEVEEGLCRTVEIELARFVEQFVGIAYIEKLVVVDLASPGHRVEDSAKRLLETYDDGVAPLVELAGTEYLFGPGLFLHDFHIFGIAEEMQLGVGYKFDAIHALSGTESPGFFARNLESALDACSLRTLMSCCHYGTSAIDEETAQFDGTIEVRFPKIPVDALPACHGATAAKDGRLAFGSTEGDGVSVASTETLVNVKRFGKQIGATSQLDDDIFLLWFAQLLLHLLKYGGEVGGICLKDLLGGEGFASEECEG